MKKDSQIDVPKLPPLIATGNAKVGYYVATYKNKWSSEKKRSIRIGSSAVGRIQGKQKYGLVEFYEDFLRCYPDLRRFDVYRREHGERYQLIPKKLRPKETAHVAHKDTDTTLDCSVNADKVGRSDADGFSTTQSRERSDAYQRAQKGVEAGTRYSNVNGKKKRGRPRLQLHLPPLLLLGNPTVGYYLATYQNKWCSKSQRSVRVTSTTVGRLKEKSKYGLIEFYPTFVEHNPCLKRYDVYRIDDERRYIMLPKRKHIQRKVACAADVEDLRHILTVLQEEAKKDAKFHDDINVVVDDEFSLEHLEELPATLTEDKAAEVIDDIISTSKIVKEQEQRLKQEAIRLETSLSQDMGLSYIKRGKSKHHRLPPLLAIVNPAHGYYYIVTYESEWNEQRHRVVRSKSRSIGRIKGMHSFGLLLLKDSFVEEYPIFKHYDVYRVEGKQHYVLVPKLKHLQRLAEQAQSAEELFLLLKPYVNRNDKHM